MSAVEKLDNLQVEDYEDLRRIVRWSPMKQTRKLDLDPEWKMEQSGRLAAKILWRHGIHAQIDSKTGAITFQKVS